MKKNILFPLSDLGLKTFKKYYMNKVRIKMLGQALIIINNHSLLLPSCFSLLPCGHFSAFPAKVL